MLLLQGRQSIVGGRGECILRGSGRRRHSLVRTTGAIATATGTAAYMMR